MEHKWFLLFSTKEKDKKLLFTLINISEEHENYRIQHGYFFNKETMILTSILVNVTFVQMLPINKCHLMLKKN